MLQTASRGVSGGRWSSHCCLGLERHSFSQAGVPELKIADSDGKEGSKKQKKLCVLRLKDLLATSDFGPAGPGRSAAKKINIHVHPDGPGDPITTTPWWNF